jgi:hypothetical protein
VKRSTALTPLSRDHQHALAVALALRRADDDGVGAATGRFRDFFESEGRAHFDIEERLLLPALPPDDPEWSAAVTRVEKDHAEIRAAAENPPATAAGAQGLGQRLHDHVRFEEYVVFDLLERRLPTDELDRLGEAVAAAERGHQQGARRP